MSKILTHLQYDVISYILAVNEERKPPENSAAHFILYQIEKPRIIRPRKEYNNRESE
jgi:hypothetical protein